MFFSFWWHLDNYLAILALCAIAIYLFLCFLGWLFDQFIDALVLGWRWAKKQYVRLKSNYTSNTSIGMDP